MKKYGLIFIAIIGNLFNVFSQGKTNTWLMGYQSWAGIPYGTTQFDFSSGNLTVSYTPRQMSFSRTLGMITNKSGNMDFYSNGIYVSNLIDDTMQNGAGLNPSPLVNSWINYGLPIAQANLVLPDLSDTNKYLLIHETAFYQSNTNTYQPHELFYSVIDMSLDSGKGAVIIKNNAILFDTLICGELTAVKHANGRDYWLIVHKAFSDKFYKFLFTPYGIIQYPDQQIGNMYYAGGAGQCAFSPHGNWYARYMPYDGLTIMQFDRCTGQFSNSLFLQINDSAAGGGVAFSSDSKKLYVPSGIYVYQFNLASANVLATQQTVAVWDSFYSPAPPFATSFYLAALADDGKIYINSTNSVMHMHMINSPDSLYPLCDLVQHGISLPTFNAYTIPNFPNYNLGPVIGSVCDSLGLGILEHDLHDFNFSVFPNPVSENLLNIQYKLPPSKNGLFQIINSTGKKAFEYHLPQWSTFQKITLPQLSNGIYLAKISSGFNFETKKFIIQK